METDTISVTISNTINCLVVTKLQQQGSLDPWRVVDEEEDLVRIHDVLVGGGDFDFCDEVRDRFLWLPESSSSW